MTTVARLLEQLAASAARAILGWTAGGLDSSGLKWLDALRGEVDAIDGGWAQLAWSVGGLRLLWEFRGRRRISDVVARSGVALTLVVVACTVALVATHVSIGVSFGILLVAGLGLIGGLAAILARATRRSGRVATTHVPLLGISPIMVAVPVLGIGAVLMLGAFAAIGAANQPDTQCTAAHAPPSAPPSSLVSATDYLALGDYDYDRGACVQAIDDYTRAINLDPELAAAYNNRAYTHMRQQDYAAALPDLDQAIALRADYVNALMNRGDIYNYYFAIDRKRAMAGYDRVIALGGASGTSVCGHRMLASHDGWNAGVIIDLLKDGVNSGCPRA